MVKTIADRGVDDIGGKCIQVRVAFYSGCKKTKTNFIDHATGAGWCNRPQEGSKAPSSRLVVRTYSSARGSSPKYSTRRRQAPTRSRVSAAQASTSAFRRFVDLAFSWVTPLTVLAVATADSRAKRRARRPTVVLPIVDPVADAREQEPRTPIKRLFVAGAPRPGWTAMSTVARARLGQRTATLGRCSRHQACAFSTCSAAERRNLIGRITSDG